MNINFSKSKVFSWNLFLFTLLIQVNNVRYFISVGGISLRPCYFFILSTLILVIFFKPRINTRFTSRWLLIGVLGIFGLLLMNSGFLRNEDWYEFGANDIRNIIFLFVQVAFYICLAISLINCNGSLFVRLFKYSFAIFIILPLVLYAIFLPRTIGTILAVVPGIFYGIDGMPRMIGLFADPNYFGLYLTVFLCVYIIMLRSFPITISRFDKAIFLLYCLAITLTFSRSAIAVNVLFIIIVLFFLRGYRRIKISVLLLMLVSILAFFSSSNPLLSDFRRKVENPTDDNGSLKERVELMELGMESVVIYPLGVGIGNVEKYYLEYYGMEKLAHNDFLTVLIECGILGLIVYLTIFYSLFSNNDGLGRIAIITIFFFLCTLTCYAYEPVIPFFMVMMDKKLIRLNRSKLLLIN